MFTTGEIVGQAEWIINDTCLSSRELKSKGHCNYFSRDTKTFLRNSHTLSKNHFTFTISIKRQSPKTRTVVLRGTCLKTVRISIKVKNTQFLLQNFIKFFTPQCRSSLKTFSQFASYENCTFFQIFQCLNRKWITDPLGQATIISNKPKQIWIENNIC